MRCRGFEKVSFEQFKKDLKEFNNIDHLYGGINLPKRSTIGSAGYDFSSLYSFVLKPGEIIKIPTGIKVYMKEDEYLTIVVRSSTGFKYNVRLCNQIVIVDTDYYNNKNNEGHIWLALQNHGDKDWIVKEGERICQGVFGKFLIVDNEGKDFKERIGGIESTGKKGRD